MKKNIFKIISLFIIGAVGGIFADQILGPMFFYQGPVIQNITDVNEIYIQENTALKDMIDKKSNVVFFIESKTIIGKILQGSGLIVATDGLLVTLAELVPKGAEIDIVSNGQKLQGKVLKRDTRANLALIQVEKEDLPTTHFVELNNLRLGERVFFIAFFSEEKEISKLVNEGIVKSFNEDFIETNIFEEEIVLGSPMFDIDGGVLGLNMIDTEGRVVVISNSKVREFAGF